MALLSIITLGIYYLVWSYKVFDENKKFSGEGIGGVIGLVLALLLGIVNWFVLPSEIGNMYERMGQEKPVARGDRVLEPDPDRRVLHLDLEGPDRDEPPVRLRKGDPT